MEVRMRTGIRASLFSALVLAVALPILAGQQPAQPNTQISPSTSTPSTTAQDKTMKSDTAKSGGARSFASGQKAEIEGIILKREPDSIMLRTHDGMDVRVALTNTTAVKEKKSNPFRSGKNYATTQLLRGLGVEVKGRGDASGNLIA